MNLREVDSLDSLERAKKMKSIKQSIKLRLTGFVSLKERR